MCGHKAAENRPAALGVSNWPSERYKRDIVWTFPSIAGCFTNSRKYSLWGKGSACVKRLCSSATTFRGQILIFDLQCIDLPRCSISWCQTIPSNGMYRILGVLFKVYLSKAMSCSIAYDSASDFKWAIRSFWMACALQNHDYNHERYGYIHSEAMVPK